MFKVGEYIRNNNGSIGKITKVIDETIFYVQYYDNIPFKTDIYETTIKAHSKNIIDLIEVGDYVNGNLIIEEYIDMCVKKKGIQVDRDEYEEGGCIDIGDYFYFKPLENIKIKNILIHELYEEECYEVGDIE